MWYIQYVYIVCTYIQGHVIHRAHFSQRTCGTFNHPLFLWLTFCFSNLAAEFDNSFFTGGFFIQPGSGCQWVVCPCRYFSWIPITALAQPSTQSTTPTVRWFMVLCCVFWPAFGCQNESHFEFEIWLNCSVYFNFSSFWITIEIA